MVQEKFQHARSTGKRLTYDVEITANRYRISLNGNLLRDAVSPMVVGNLSPEEAIRVFAIADIETLHDMQEE